MTVPDCMQGIRLAEVSTLPREIIEDAKQISQLITEQQKVPYLLTFVLNSLRFV